MRFRVQGFRLGCSPLYKQSRRDHNNRGYDNPFTTGNIPSFGFRVRSWFIGCLGYSGSVITPGNILRLLQNPKLLNPPKRCCV